MSGQPGAGTRRRVKVVILVLAGLLVIAAGAAAVYTLSLARSFDEGRTVVEEAFPDEEIRPAPPAPESKAHRAQNILLLGSDTRGAIGDDIDAITGARADAIMVVHLPAERDTVHVMSIMRDNWVPIHGYGHNKINAALAFGGVPLMVATVENFIDARIDHVAVVDFDGFQGLTDALEGVTVVNDRAFSARGHSFAEGAQRLGGEEALVYVRERMAFPDGDYQRARNQQAYIKGVISAVLSRDTLTSPGKVSEVVEAISPFLTVDEGLNSSYVGGLGFEMRGLRAGDVRFFTSPTLGTGWEGTQSVVRPDWDRIEELRAHFRNDSLADYVP